MFWRREVLRDRRLDPDFAAAGVDAARARATFPRESEWLQSQCNPKGCQKRVDKVMANYRAALFDSAAIWTSYRSFSQTRASRAASVLDLP